MFEGLYFEFPKLGFLIFVFLACETLCPLRHPSFYFPHIHHFELSGVRVAPWMWISKWLMISFLIVALMSPVKDEEQIPQFEGYSTLFVVDTMTLENHQKIAQWCSLRPYDSISLYLPPTFKIPLSKDHKTLLSMIEQIPEQNNSSSIDMGVKTFLIAQKRPWIVILAEDPKHFVHSLPTNIEYVVMPKKNTAQWMREQSEKHPPIPLLIEEKSLKYFYFYPLFLAFLSMLVYLYGRNQKGIG